MQKDQSSLAGTLPANRRTIVAMPDPILGSRAGPTDRSYPKAILAGRTWSRERANNMLSPSDTWRMAVRIRLKYGRYPRDLDGLAAILTMDMAVVDVAWIGMKLRKLLDYDEPMGSFLAKTPGTGKTERYSSIVAYLARLILHRYATLGLLTASGYPVVEMGVMVSVPGDASNVVPIAA